MLKLQINLCATPFLNDLFSLNSKNIIVMTFWSKEIINNRTVNFLYPTYRTYRSSRHFQINAVAAVRIVVYLGDQTYLFRWFLFGLFGGSGEQEGSLRTNLKDRQTVRKLCVANKKGSQGPEAVLMCWSREIQNSLKVTYLKIELTCKVQVTGHIMFNIIPKLFKYLFLSTLILLTKNLPFPTDHLIS